MLASFRSTLEEIIASHLFITVLDVSDPHAHLQLDTVSRTLDEIGATTQPRILVLNKIDQLANSADVLVWLNRRPDAIPISASTGEGLDELRAAVKGHFLGAVREVNLAMHMGDARAINFIEQRATVLDRQYIDSTAILRVRIGRRQVDQLLAQGGRFTIDGMKPHEALEAHWGNGKPPVPVRVPPHERHVG